MKPIANPHRQVKLRHGSYTLVANLPADRRIKRGAQITLKDCGDPEQLWTVEWVSEQVTAKADLKTTGAWWTIR